MSKRNIIFLVVLLLSAGLLWYFNHHTSVSGGHSYAVVLTKDGFVPERIVIHQGDTVTFKTSTQRGFWPASDPHPTHEIYPEFDPKKIIQPNETWNFVFTQKGTWLYHDHLSHQYQGTVVVLDKSDASDTALSAKNDCERVDVSQKPACWDAMLKDSLSSGGLDSAFDTFRTIYNTDPGVPKACHEWGHVLGEAAFQLYSSGQKISFRKEMSFCGYGFFHGFLGKLTAYTGDVASSRKWCESFVENTDPNSGAWRNCVHGVGHGTTAWLLEDPQYWGNFQKVASKGLSFCEQVFDAATDTEECYDGVFNELHLDLLNSDYNFNFAEFRERKDPFFYCRGQEDRHKQSCYYEFVGIFYRLFDFDSEASMKYVIDNVENLKLRGPKVVSKLAADIIQFDIVNSEYKRNINICRSVPGYLFDDCLGGIVNGFIQHGEPENMHVRALSFCNADYLTKKEQGFCITRLFGQLRATYSPQKLLQACGMVDEDKQALCEITGNQ